MANRTTPLGGRFTGWFNDSVTPALKYYLSGTLVMTVSGNDVTLPDKLTVTGTSALAGPILGSNTLPVVDGTATHQLTDAAGNGTISWAAKA